MIIQLHKHISREEKEYLDNLLKDHRFNVKRVHTQLGEYIIALGKEDIDIRTIGNLKGVEDVHAVHDDHHLVSAKWKTDSTRIVLDENTVIGGEGFSVTAGPCSVESEQQVEQISDFLQDRGIRLMRGGVFKPRSSPYSYRGAGIEGLKYFARICHEKGIRVVTEIMQEEMIDSMYPYVDVFQVGARNSQNYNLLDALGKIDKPVLLKRGLSGTLDELLYSAEYIFSGGNERIVLCERGIRTFEKSYRNTLDLNAVPLLKEKTHLPVMVDPSHGTGIRDLVEPMTLASIMSGADGVLIEIHEHPPRAISDAKQTISLEQMHSLQGKIDRTLQLRRQLREES
ncbi:MAG: 3-deoxy-7-phosphoheptulonate synthase [Bacteroidales bacterium]|nr:3-deoxy-7-phosphoheptulonate synthase [Bacteroidales bacterium]